MKRKVGISLILVSFVFNSIGGVLKIRHAKGSDFFLALGIIAFIIGVAIMLYKFSEKKSV